MTSWHVNRRWDPCVWQAGGRWHMLCLAADYTAEGNAKPWWMGDNALERWSGDSLDKIAIEHSVRRTGRIWTAPSVFVENGDVVAMAGLNDDGPIPNQRLVYIDPYNLDIEGGRPPPPAPPRQYAWRGNIAWRDPTICRMPGGYLLTATTGGFRWGNHPQVLGFRSDSPRGPWEPLGPMIDPSICVLFAEMERPQVIRLQDGRYALIFSCWPERQFLSAIAPASHILISPWDEPVFTRYLGNFDAGYGVQRYDDHWAFWFWTNRESYESTCRIQEADITVDELVRRFECTSSH